VNVETDVANAACPLGATITCRETDKETPTMLPAPIDPPAPRPIVLLKNLAIPASTAIPACCNKLGATHVCGPLFGGRMPTPPPSPRAEGLLTPAAECLIAGSGERQRSASRLEMVTPSPSRCRHRNRPVRHHMQRYLRP